MRNKTKIFGLILAISMSSAFAYAESENSLAQRAQKAADILAHAAGQSDRSIPQSLLAKAVCVATIPHIVRAGFVFGARYGKGLVSCRTASGWSSPSFVEVKGGSWGLQIGIQTIDLVLVFVNANAIEAFSHDNFTMGADLTVSAGPLGRDAQIGTDYKLDNSIYSYSHTKGLFAGLALQGTKLSVQKSDNAKIYGEMSANTLLTTENMTLPLSMTPYIAALMNYAH